MMRGVGGYLIITDPDPQRSRGQQAVQEWDTFTCAHCQRVQQVKPLAKSHESPGRCFACDKLICQQCLGKGCTPFEKKLEEYERRMQFRSAL